MPFPHRTTHSFGDPKFSIRSFWILKTDYSLSVNTNVTDAGKSFETIKDVPFRVKCMRKPKLYPLVEVYYPSNAVFSMYDVIIAIYVKVGQRDIYGYQFKEGIKIPTKKDPLIIPFEQSVRPTRRDIKQLFGFGPCLMTSRKDPSMASREGTGLLPHGGSCWRRGKETLHQ